MGIQRLLKIAGLVLLVLATLIALGHVSTDFSAALIPGGLACWLASEV